MQGTILSQITGTSLRPSSLTPRKKAQTTALGPTSYSTGSVNPNPTVFAPRTDSFITGISNPNPTAFGAASTPSYLESSFRTSLTYRPPAIRTANNAFTAGIGFFGSSALGSVPGAPSGQPPIVPPPVGYFQYQGSITYFDVLPNGTEYYVTQ